MIKVLIVDDEKCVRRGIIEKTDWKALDAEVVCEARNGLEGLDMAMKFLPDIVITDMKMPVMDGIELISRIYEELPKIKVVVVSGYTDYEYTRQALLNKAVDYILKPIEPATINEVLSRAVLECKKSLNTGKVADTYEKYSSDSINGMDTISGARETIHKVREYVACHYNEKISLNFISEKFYINDTYFCKLFKKETGQNFLDYLTSVRMQKARILIEEHHAKIYEAASLVGYEDARHFSKLFRKYLLMKED